MRLPLSHYHLACQKFPASRLEPGLPLRHPRVGCYPTLVCEMNAEPPALHLPREASSTSHTHTQNAVWHNWNMLDGLHRTELSGSIGLVGERERRRWKGKKIKELVVGDLCIYLYTSSLALPAAMAAFAMRPSKSHMVMHSADSSPWSGEKVEAPEGLITN